MFKFALTCLALTSMKTVVRPAFAFDPFTIATIAGASQNMMNKVDDLADLGFAVTDLMQEVGVDTDDQENSIQKTIDRVSKLNSEVQDLKWTTDDFIQSINEDLRNGSTLAKRIRALKNAISASKKIAAIMGFKPSAAEKAAQIQQIKIDSMMLEELQAMRKAQYLEYLESKESRLKREEYLAQITGVKNNLKLSPVWR